MKNRNAGVLLHISSLPGGYSIGSFGSAARRFVDKLAEGGFRLWQILPLSMTDECNSPYKSPASFGGNPYFIDLEELYIKGLLSGEELRSAKEEVPYRAEFSRLNRERLLLLSRAAERVLDRTPIIEFIDSEPALSRAAHFLALSEANGGAPWQEWSIHECDIDRLFFWQFIQYEFYTQWWALKEYANSRGISIIGDIPIYVAESSADVWGSPDDFLLDSRGYPTEVAGVPPDYFSEDGQLWGNPLYNFKKMKADGFSFWRERLEFAFRLYDGVRIDHFRAIAAFWAVPKGAASARAGRWRRGPGRAFVDMVKEVARGRLVIAEDLGDITDDVRRLVRYSGFPGMRVAQFAFLGDPHSVHLPHNTDVNTIVYTGTHDNNTLLGYIWEMGEGERARLFDYIGITSEPWETAPQRMIRTLLATPARSVIIPVQDIFGFGADTRMNTPGVAEGNWTFRLTREQLEAFPSEALGRTLRLFER